MKIILYSALFGVLASSLSAMTSDDVIGEFVELTDSEHSAKIYCIDPTDRLLGDNHKDDEYKVTLARTMQLMSLAEHLISVDKEVTTKTLAQATRFSSTTLSKRNEKKELQADLTSRLDLYKEQLVRSEETIQALLSEIKHYEEHIIHITKKTDQTQAALDEESSHREKLELHTLVPEELTHISRTRLRELEEEKRTTQTALDACTAKKIQLLTQLTYNKSVMSEIAQQKELTQNELATVVEILGNLDEALVRVGIKYKTTSPAVVVEAFREHTQIAAHTNLDLLDEKAFNWAYKDKSASLWETFCRLMRRKQRECAKVFGLTKELS